jgi:hypothetical protein
MALAKAIEQQSESFICLYGMTALNLQMQRRRKYYETGAAVYWKMLVPYQAALRITKNKKLAAVLSRWSGSLIRLIDGLTRPRGLNLKNVKKIDRFDDSFDLLLARISSKTGIQTFKDSTYLNWKYIDRPYPHEVVFAGRQDGQTMGYIVLALQHKENLTGKIVDLLADPDDKKTVASLIAQALAYFRSQGALPWKR